MRTPLLTSRIGRRVVRLFIVSALVPLALCAIMLYRAYDAEFEQTQTRGLDEMMRSFGMTVLSRLGSADDVLQTLIAAPGATDDSVQSRVSELNWVRRARRGIPARFLQGHETALPVPDTRQRKALMRGASVILCTPDGDGREAVHLMHALPSGAWLDAEISPAWLWAAADEFLAGAGMRVLDAGQRIIFSAGNLPPATPPTTGRRGGDAPAKRTTDGARWLSRSWEIFLGSRYDSPSWRLMGMTPRSTLLQGRDRSYPLFLGLIALTILLIAWLSMKTIRRQLRPLALLTQATTRVAQRDFDAFHDMHLDDEFGDLACSFDAMSKKLKMQFSALETLAEVDRLLLRAPALEVILDSLLPRIANALECDSVSVILFDRDSAEHARAYDFFTAEGRTLPVRRITTDRSAMTAVCVQSSRPRLDADAASEFPCLAWIGERRISTLLLQPLRHEARWAGVLCIGFAAERADVNESAVGVADFADRLSLILNNLEQTALLHRQAKYDSLTGLQNRYELAERVRVAVESATTRQGAGSLLYLDLDHFKRINDTAGHSTGDRLLRIVGERLRAIVGADQSVARLGGDEFAVLLPCISDPNGIRQFAEGILASLQYPIQIGGREHHVAASIGITMFPADGSTLEELLKAGDIAMYQAKEAGRGCAVFYQAEMQRKLIERMRLESGLERAFANDEFRLHYQPIVSYAADCAIGVEALIRWPGEHPDASVPPGVFIPVAEENGIIIKIGDWILRSACKQYADWRAAGLRLGYISVNVSVRQLREPGYLAALRCALTDSAMHGGELQLEITESVLAQGSELASTLAGIAQLGVRLALDDFGTGYSSLSYLRTYPIHTVKIDRSFITGLPHDPAACRLAESIIVMCAALEKRVVAEGVETEAQLAFLRQSGCTSIQGYLLGRPMEGADIPGFVGRLRSLTAAESPGLLRPEPPGLLRPSAIR